MWQLFLVCLIIGFLFLILEMFTPSLFFLNFAVAAFICALLSFLIQDVFWLVIIFSVLSVVLIFTLRPLLMKNRNNNDTKTGMESKYVGKSAVVIDEIDSNKGAISIYDERWQARNIEEGVIPVDANVEIVGYDSLIMKVKEIK